MNVSSVSSAQTTALTQRPDSASTRKAFQAAAKALDMSTDDLRSALKDGQSLSDLAKAKGVSESTLTDAITSAVPSANAADIAQNLLSGPGGHGGPGGGPGGPGGPPPPPRDSRVDSALSAVQDALGIDDLDEELASGESLTDVAAANGMDAETLKTTLTTAISAADSTLSADAVSELADKIIEGPPKPQQDTASARQEFDLSQTSYDSTAVSKQLLQSLYAQQSQLATSSSWAA
ncbi:hypothetical protein [Actinokineospora globicatena]|uniref:hypothetical protein n=1 Tax=Actinokineospora globicatena TaxID=103729 RepID=UPI0020A3B739|nr:hypothetical protein [Actinokineospora globicatena]MCP2304002.1 hypothetical protein [Actinokineospora globicatena]GLW78834.1 hypothetical protein Aglo01_33160 [Actinokineospora globicatena]GLW86753.1 hypothetical protein Aglo02_43920 [Actinokineospora globicatena]